LKLLLDENLSPRLVDRLNLLFPGMAHLKQCDFPLREIEDWLRKSAVRISEFGRNEATGLLSLRYVKTAEGR